MNTLWAKSLLIAALVCAVPGAAAHTRSESFSHWYLSDTGVTGTVTIPLREVMLLYSSADATIAPQQIFQTHLEENTRVYSATSLCVQRASNTLQSASGFVRVELQFDCGAEKADQLQYRAMFAAAPAHVHYAKLHRDGVMLGESLMTDAADTIMFDDLAANNSWSFASFIRIGMQHIAGGIDHIAFLLGLLLIAGNLRRSVIAVTGFTVGHSISLAAAVLGYVRADSRLVEAFIGLTVALVAVEYFAQGRRDNRALAISSALFAGAIGIAALLSGVIESSAVLAYLGFGIFTIFYLLLVDANANDANRQRGALLLVVTTCFGVVHGFGFAGFLMETGLLGNSLLIPLLGFNLGVELGQLIIVALALTCVASMRNRIPVALPQLLAAGLCAVGVFWFVERSLF